MLTLNKALKNKGIETFRDRLMLNEDSNVDYNDYYNSVFNTSLGYIFLCMFLLFNVVPAVLIATNCPKDNKILHLLFAFLFSDIYVFIYVVRRFVYNDKKYCL